MGSSGTPPLPAVRLGAGTAWSVAMQVVTAAANIIVGILVSRALGPDGKGTLSIIQQSVAILLIIGDLGIGLAAVYYISKSEVRPGTVLGNALVALVAVSGAAFVVMLVLFRSPLAVVELSWSYTLAAFGLFVVSLGMSWVGSIAVGVRGVKGLARPSIVASLLSWGSSRRVVSGQPQRARRDSGLYGGSGSGGRARDDLGLSVAATGGGVGERVSSHAALFGEALPRDHGGLPSFSRRRAHAGLDGRGGIGRHLLGGGERRRDRHTTAVGDECGHPGTGVARLTRLGARSFGAGDPADGAVRAGGRGAARGGRGVGDPAAVRCGVPRRGDGVLPAHPRRGRQFARVADIELSERAWKHLLGRERCQRWPQRRAQPVADRVIWLLRRRGRLEYLVHGAVPVAAQAASGRYTTRRRRSSWCPRAKTCGSSQTQRARTCVAAEALAACSIASRAVAAVVVQSNKAARCKPFSAMSARTFGAGDGLHRVVPLRSASSTPT